MLVVEKKFATSEQTEIKAIKKEFNSSCLTSIVAVVIAIAIAFGVMTAGKSAAEEIIAKKGILVQSGNTTDNLDNDSSTPSDGVIVDNETDDIDDSTDSLDSTDSTDNSVDGDGQSKDEEPEVERELPANPAEWTKTEIVNYYKKAANNSTGVKSIQKMTMEEGIKAEISNNTIQNLVELAMPVMKAALKANSTEFDGITGGYNDLVPSDVKTAKAYKDGKDVIIEMTLVEQKDGADGDTFKGTVGHGISVVGDITVIADIFSSWTFNFDEAFIELHYVNPVIKVRINEDGVIEKGSWSYVVHVTVKKLQIAKIIVEDASGDIDYIVTTGGGF